jgi:hypothetical protein
MTAETESIPAQRGARQHRSPTLGVTAAVVVGLSTTTVALTTLPFLYVPSLNAIPEPTGYGWPSFFQTIGMLVGLVLAVIALITGRGRWWAAAAIVLAVLGSFYTILFLESLFPTPGKGG